MNVYINAKEFKNDDITLMFKKDLVTVEELVDKIYELQDIIEEQLDEIDTLKDDCRWLQEELKAIKDGYRPEFDRD